MIYKPKGRRFYRVKFMWKGRMIHKSTQVTSAKSARQVEVRIKDELGKDNWGILQSGPSLGLSDFLKGAFLPFIETQFPDHAQQP